VNGRRGHPVLFDAAYVPDILALQEPQTLRDLVRSPATKRIEVEMADAGELSDLDTPEDYRAALSSGRFED
jgi:molybdenum cofactor cytidylyltransferase